MAEAGIEHETPEERHRAMVAMRELIPRKAERPTFMVYGEGKWEGYAAEAPERLAKKIRPNRLGYYVKNTEVKFHKLMRIHGEKGRYVDVTREDYKRMHRSKNLDAYLEVGRYGITPVVEAKEIVLAVGPKKKEPAEVVAPALVLKIGKEGAREVVGEELVITMPLRRAEKKTMVTVRGEYKGTTGWEVDVPREAAEEKKFTTDIAAYLKVPGAVVYKLDKGKRVRITPRI